MQTIARPKEKVREDIKRHQLNIGFQRDSSLPKRLDEAERLTGWSRTQIAREVLEMFLDAWLAAEITKHEILEQARNRALERLPVLPAVRVRARDAGQNRPEGGYSDVAMARRHIPFKASCEVYPADLLPATEASPRAKPLTAVEEDDE